VDELLPLIAATHCVVLVVVGEPSPSQLDAMRALTEEAAVGKAVVGVVGVTQANSSS
jgi:hypothetical protein